MHSALAIPVYANVVQHLSMEKLAEVYARFANGEVGLEVRPSRSRARCMLSSPGLLITQKSSCLQAVTASWVDLVEPAALLLQELLSRFQVPLYSSHPAPVAMFVLLYSSGL